MRRALLIATLITTFFQVFSQTWEKVTSDRTYIYGEGWGNTIEEADKQALADLISKIQVEVSGRTDHIESETASIDGINTQSQFASAVTTYSHATLNNTEKVVLSAGPDAHVGRWMLRTDVRKIFLARIAKINDYVESGRTALNSENIDLALKDFYWALALLRSLQDPNEPTLASGQGSPLLSTWIPKQINSILRGISVKTLSRSGDIVEVAFLYNDRPVRSLDFEYFDGRDWSYLCHVQNGIGQLELAPGYSPQYFQVTVEYRYPAAANVDSEVKAVIDATSETYFPDAFRSFPNEIPIDQAQPGQNTTIAEQNTQPDKPAHNQPSRPANTLVPDKQTLHKLVRRQQNTPIYPTRKPTDPFQQIIRSSGAKSFSEGSPQSDYNAFRDSLFSSFGTFHDNALSDYERYRNRINSEYVHALASPTAWSPFQRQAPIDIPTNKIPVVKPVVYDHSAPHKPMPVYEVRPEIVTVPTPQPTPPVPITTPVNVPTTPVKTFSIVFYGTSFTFPVPHLAGAVCRTASNEEIARVWSLLADGRMDPLMSQAIMTRDDRHFNDWMYLTLIQDIAKAIFPGDTNSQAIATAYLFSNSGYKMRLGRTASAVTALFASDCTIYRRSYYSIDGDKYYILSDIGQGLSICPTSFRGERPLSLIYSKEPALDAKPSSPRTLKSSMGISVTSKVNENLIPLYDSYPAFAPESDPLSQWVMTCDAPISGITRRQLYPQLQLALSGKSIYDKVNLLLNFVQTAFTYRLDDEIWGQDRAFYPDETLYYPYSDCEDRTALFTRLVRDLTGLKCAVLYYPGHLAAAVKFPPETNVVGDCVKVNGETYIICDPTYINASVGTAMPNLPGPPRAVTLP